MAAETKSGGTVRFSVFELNIRSGELCKRGTRLPIQGRPVQLLTVLVENAGEIVTREELRNRLWPADTFVDFDHGLHNAIARLREVLGDSADTPRFIETLPRRGYRFIVPIQCNVSKDIAPASGETTASAAKPATPFRRTLIALLALVFSALAAAGAWFYSKSNRAPQSPAIRSLAVLPLTNLSGDSSQDYFADGMTDALITELAQFSSLRVISRTSAMHYKGSHQPLPEIARELNVDAVVEGGVIHSGNRVRITAQLLEARSDRHLWAKAYDRDIREILSLQQDVAENIVNEIQAKLTPQENVRLSRKRQVDPEAYDDYLRGLYFWQKFTEAGTRRAVAYFEESVRKDSSYALGYAGLANAYHELALYVDPEDAMPRSKEASRKALQLDDTLADAHASMGYVRWVYDWDWPGAESEFQRAIQLNPGHAICHGMYAKYLDSMGRFEEAFREHRIARELDPVALVLINDAAAHFLVLRQFDEAIEEYRIVVDMDPNFVDAHQDLAIAYKGKGMEEESISELEQAAMLNGERNLAEAMKIAYVRGGYKGALRARLKYNQHRRSAGTYVDFWDDAWTQAQLGNKDLALQALEKAFSARENIVWLNADPEWDPIRADPRFQDLVRRVGLPVITGSGRVPH